MDMVLGLVVIKFDRNFCCAKQTFVEPVPFDREGGKQ